MAVTPPVATPRGTPTGIPLQDGFSTKITIAANTTVSFWEKTVKPPAIEGGDAIDTTTMFNVLWKTKAPRKLLEIPDFTITVAYDPVMYTAALSLVNVPSTITVTFPEGTTIAFYGYMKNFVPNDVSEGVFPEASVTLVVTNYDNTGKGESGPVVVNVAGT